MIKTLTSFFRFYYYVIRKSPKRFDIAMSVNQGTVTAITPLFLFLGFTFASITFGRYDLAMFFPLAIPIVLGNMFFVRYVSEQGYNIQAEIRRERQEAERLQREQEYAEQRRKQEEEARRREEELDRLMREFFERMRKKQQQQQSQQKYQNRQQRQQATSNNNMANARRLSKIHHPDVGGKEVNFLKLKKAYDYVMARI